MALRSTSGKFGLPSFGRRRGSDSQPSSRIASGSAAPQGAGSGDNDESLASPTTATGSNFSPSHNYSNSTGGHLDGLGKKIGKKVAHTSLLPALGNQDLRALQDIINSEKDVLKASDKMAQETSSAAAKLPPYGQSEGPDLQDILTHSATLLTQLGDAYRTFAGHEASLRVCFKRIREREEKLDEMRRSRRTMTSKAEAAERKLSKMGAENKQLLQQTELLERLRAEMRQIDADIVVEESKLGDFKRQMVKEAMSYKFGGLEELGEKMCIVGELGKLLLEEIPLEETPPGYSRAPYEGYTQTEKTTKEALRCLAQVQFHAASAAPKPPGLPGINNSPLQQAALGNGPVPEQSIAQREEYGDYVPGTEASTPTSPQSPPRIPAIPGLDDRRGSDNEYGATQPPTHTGVVWQGPPDDALDHPYEYEQQRAIDEQSAEAAPAPSYAPTHERTPSHGAPIAERFATTLSDPAAEPVQPESPKAAPGWEPLRVSNRDSTGASMHSGPRYSLHDGPGYTLPAQEESAQQPPAALDQHHAEAPLTESYLGAPAREQRPVTADGYYTPDDESVVAVNPAPASPPGHRGIPPSASAQGLAYDDEPVVTIHDDPVITIPDVAPASPTAARQLPPIPQQAGDVPVVVIHEKPGYRPPASPPRASSPGVMNDQSGYRAPASPPRIGSPEDAVHSTLDSYYAASGPTTPNEEKQTGYTPAASNGVMSAAAFRRGAKQRPSFNDDDKPAVPQGYQGTSALESPPPGYHEEDRR